MITSKDIVDPARLTAEDLVPDEPLQASGKTPISDNDDLLHHRVIARKVAELATSSKGKVNIALFGPWGSGKSSFNGLLKEELKAIEPKARHITFDAWKNSGEGFRTNFLSELARQVPRADPKISDQLFEATTKVTLPFAGPFQGERGGKRLFFAAAGFLIALFIVAPLAWTVIGNFVTPTENFFAQWWTNISGWAGIAVSSTLLIVVAAGLVELSKVTVSRSTPSHVAQFSELFHKLLKTDGGDRYVVFIDELDRCGQEDVMATLEGLRTFLGHDRCVFVVAFDRGAVASTIAEHMRHAVPYEAASPYYRTSGEYLDKIFQFQIALPPQPAHTFRRFALSLVRERAGVWGELRASTDGLLDRVITVLSPMHLASPRRTKVLLNDFAVNARIFESLGFDWLDRAEEIAVLTVLQTEFPNLMADIERSPSLMRFVYRNEAPSRPEVANLLIKYSQPAVSDDADSGTEAPLDRIVVGADVDVVARDLQENLGRYLRRLREMDVPEPRADLIMMHSDGNLLHFDDPDIYHQVLLAADTPRQDVVEAFSASSASDRALAIEHLLEQAERESAEIALSVRILAGELAAELPSMPIGLASTMRPGTSVSLQGHSQKSLEGYARAVAAAFTSDAYAKLMSAAKNSSEITGLIISRLTDELSSQDWDTVRPAILTQVLGRAPSIPAVVATVFRRVGSDPEAELGAQQISELAKLLSVSEPDEVLPQTATAAAKQEAQQQNADALEAFEAERAELRSATEEILEVWQHLPVGGGMRRSLLRVLRASTDGTTWHSERHDELIAEDIESGEIVSANSHLLTAIAEQPWAAAARWRGLLSDEAPVDVADKASALAAVVGRAVSTADVNSQTNGAANAHRIASLPSKYVPAADLLAKIVEDLSRPWEEYSDSRFEYQFKLLDAVDVLGDADAETTPHRAHLVTAAVQSAQAEEAAVGEIVRSVKNLQTADLVAVTNALHESGLWDTDAPEGSIRVLLTAQEALLSAGESVVPLPASAISRMSPAVRGEVAQTWLQTVPDTRDVEDMLDYTSFTATAWQRYGERAPEHVRAAMWQVLISRRTPVNLLRALSRPGQPIDVYEEAAKRVRDAGNKAARESAMDQFLALPAERVAASVAQALLKAVAQSSRRTELPLGIRLAKAYVHVWPKTTVASLRPHLTPWVEAGEAYAPRRDIKWLAEGGFVTRKSSLWDQIFGGRNQ
jgi:hypothetical protein